MHKIPMYQGLAMGLNEHPTLNGQLSKGSETRAHYERFEAHRKEYEGTNGADT